MGAVHTVRPGETALLAAIEALFSRELGAGLYPSAYLRDLAGDPRAVLVAALDGRSVAGAAGAQVLAPEDLDYYLAFGAGAIAAIRRRTVGSLEALAVEPAFRRRGIGRLLLEVRLERLRELGCDAAIAISWVSGHPGASAPLFRSAGMLEGPTVPDFYRDDSIRAGWSCPVDGTPCRCAATLFTIDLAARDRADVARESEGRRYGVT